MHSSYVPTAAFKGLYRPLSNYCLPRTKRSLHNKRTVAYCIFFIFICTVFWCNIWKICILQNLWEIMVCIIVCPEFFKLVITLTSCHHLWFNFEVLKKHLPQFGISKNAIVFVYVIHQVGCWKPMDRCNKHWLLMAMPSQWSSTMCLVRYQLVLCCPKEAQNLCQLLEAFFQMP